jgi:hypothetical protein
MHLETAFFEDTDGAEVVLGHERKEGPLTQKIDELTESACRDAFLPMVATDPVTDQSLIVLNPASDATGNLVAEQDGSIDGGFIGPDLCPVLQMGLLLAGWECGHLDCNGIALVVVENLDVRVCDFA